MYYVKRAQISTDINAGDGVMLLRDLPEVPAGTKGKVIGIVSDGVRVSFETVLDFLPRTMNFSHDEVDLLAIETDSHPGK